MVNHSLILDVCKYEDDIVKLWDTHTMKEIAEILDIPYIWVIKFRDMIGITPKPINISKRKQWIRKECVGCNLHFWVPPSHNFKKYCSMGCSNSHNPRWLLSDKINYGDNKCWPGHHDSR